jgi:hypothetical protein
MLIVLVVFVTLELLGNKLIPIFSKVTGTLDVAAK